ncbi:protein tyrosine phosphatase (PTP) superfamily phosphohydrolase (DUF442 family) [Novosphingobium sp. PhB165]|uniref:beta-lactamase hydrolase domain-containing protein n=1 Tax=Novosphingobium sp. PhB165 TaxID=2485105 RepID=UPI00104D91FF|nr:sulfur transferase domain-containing protein [Novosphingobium sp. PhB165]TCM18989.1 protein tyrosine phosphatase (PTP) superfamily phosphohydrolase (DUF442 family) [Novosphingobium sp. PhB165]
MDDPKDIACWQRIDARLTTSGKLVEGDPGRLAALGVRRVINLALADHPDALPGEAAELAAVGIDYVHIPVPFDAPGESHFAAFEAAMADAGEVPVHVHCIFNWRVSAFLYRWNRTRGMPETEARDLMRVQWEPETNSHNDAPVWARFIAGD